MHHVLFSLAPRASARCSRSALACCSRSALARCSCCALAIAAMIVAGCGLGLVDNPSGGGDNLPTQGAGPYGKPGVDFETPADEPYVLSQARVHLRDPSALPRADGGFRLWFGREPLDDATGEIWYAELPAITQLADRPPEPALVPDQPWEDGWVGKPSVIALPDGSLVMYYQGGLTSPAIGRAVSTDGVTWQKYSFNPILTGSEPTAGHIPDASPGSQFVLYFTRPDEPGFAGIWLAEATDGIAFEIRPEPVLLPRPDDPEAFDRDAVTNPAVIVRRTAAGRTHFGLFFNGSRTESDPAGTDAGIPDAGTPDAGDAGTPDPGDAPADIAIGWAGSFDGVTWTRFASPEGPVLAPGGVTEHGPSAVLDPDRGFLFFHEVRQGTDRIAVATHP